MKIRTEQVISCQDWDKLVQKTYDKPYNFQQQEGCKGRGYFRFEVPGESYDDEMNDLIPENVNDEMMGIKFAKWLERDPKQVLSGPPKRREEQYAIELWWERNFYPDFQTVANDLHKKGLLKAGEYSIDIDW